MKEYNKLTKELLAQGYTVDNYPNYVKIDTSQLPGNDPLNNMGGGFVYKVHVRDEFVYKTGCGLYVKGSNVYEMGYYIEWRHEDDNPVVNCPYRNANCEHNDERLRVKLGLEHCFQCPCVCHRTDEPYDYDKSVEKANNEHEAFKKQKYEEFVATHNGRVCENHVTWNESKQEWVMVYTPSWCANICYAKDGYCPILGKKLDKKKGNVYYDLKEIHIRQDDTFFSGEEIVTITKGLRFFKSPVSMDICNAFIKVQSEKIYRRYHWNTESTMQIFDKTFKGEIINIRAESKPSRDLMQDLEDIQNGISIVHASDQEKYWKEYKRKKREQSKQKALDKIKKKVIQNGLESLTYSENKKLENSLSSEEIYELSSQYFKRLEDEKNKPTQLDLFQMGLVK